MIRQTVAEYLKERMNAGNAQGGREDKSSDSREQEAADEH